MGPVIVTPTFRLHADITNLLKQGMGANLHWFPEDVPLSRLAATLVGMANSSGGMILVGVAPRNAQVTGVIDVREALDRIFQAALLADPPLVLPIPEIQTVGEANVLLISIPVGLPHVYNLEGRYLAREGTQTNPIPARRLRQMLLQRGLVQFESRAPANSGLDDLDFAKVQEYASSLNLPGSDSPEQVLLRRGCLVQDGLQLKPTYAALLLFGCHPQQWLPNASILAARFSGRTFDDHFIKQDMRGSLSEQLVQAEMFVRDNLRQTVKVAGMAHREELEYPFEAVRELLVNAAAHRDYNVQGDCIHLNIFADRLEVSSPGELPGPVNLNNLLEARFSRNAVISQVLADMGYVERLGYGLDRVVKSMRSAGLRAPRFEETAGSFRVILFNEFMQKGLPEDIPDYEGIDLNPRQEQAMWFLKKYKRITSSNFQELCPEVHAETLRRDLVDLVKRGLLLKIGDKKATYYILKRG
jgi:ATP-dependent DNA helicase RecG